MDRERTSFHPKISSELRYKPSWKQPYQKALLEWTHDDIIRLTATDLNGVQHIVVHVPVMRIQKFTIFQGSVRLQIDNITYRLDESKWDRGLDFGASLGGPLGILVAARAENKSGLKWWIEPLKSKNIPVHYYGTMWLMKIVAALTGLFIVAVIFSAVSK